MRFAAAVVLVLTVASPAGAHSQQPERTSSSAFTVEAAGAAAGSLIALGTSYYAVRAIRGPCDVEDLGCLIKRIGVIGVASVPGATLGGYLAGRAADTRPSVKGLVAGAVVGVAAGAAAARGVEALGVRHVVPLAVVYSLVQGTTTALGSRLWR